MRNNLLFIIVCCLFAFKSSATIHVVAMSDFQFTPSSFSAQVGDTVVWNWSSASNMLHTTTSTTIPSGATPWDASLTASNASFMYVITTPGTYNYVCTPHSPGMAGSFTVTPVKVQEVSQLALIKTYPNPASSNLHIVFNDTRLPASIRVTNMIGSTLIKRDYSFTKETDINVSAIPNGVYFINVEQGGKSHTSRINIIH